MQQQSMSGDTVLLRTLINYEAQNFAAKRLLREKELIDRESIPMVGIAAQPLQHDLFTWHSNIRGPQGTLYEGGVFHLEVTIPTNYPHYPPKVTFCHESLPHPNVQERVVCLDMLDPQQKGQKNGGWTSAFTLQSVLLQLQAFLFEEFIGGDKQAQTQRKELIKKAVKEANEFKCSTKNCKHGGKLSLWPKFNELETDPKAFINLKSSSELIESDFVCFHTRLPYRQLNILTIETDTNIKKESCLGIMLQVTKVPRTGAVKAAIASLDYISIKAFINEGIRHDSTKNKYQFWLPLYFGKKDDKQRVLHLLKKSVSMIMTNSTRRFKPEYIMELFPRLTQNIGFGMMDQKTHPSIKSIRILSQIHALWLVCMEEWPQLHLISNNIVKKFIENPVERDKIHTPNLGVLFNLLYVSNKFTFNDLVTCYTEEQLDRQVFWIFKELPELADEAKESRISAAKRAEISFKQQRTPFQMSCYQYLYLSICKKHFGSTKELLAKFEDNFCLLTTGQENALQARIFEIQKTVINYDAFYDFIQLPRKSEEELDLQLRQAIKNSKAKNYHGTLEEINQVPPREEQIKEYNKKFKQLQDLYEIQDELQQNKHSYKMKLKNKLTENDWKQLLTERWEWIEDELYWNPETTPTQLTKLANSRLMYGSGDKPIDRLYTKIQKQRDAYQTYENMEAAQIPFPEQSWEQLFMKLDFEEQLLQININPDFKIFYQKLAIICEKVTDLIIPLVSADHLQSGYNYIKGTLEKLTNLERLTFTIPIGVPNASIPKKAAKSIFKGMNNLSKQKNKLRHIIYNDISFKGIQNDVADCLFSPLLNYLDQIQLLQIEQGQLLTYENCPKIVAGLITSFKNLEYLILKGCILNLNCAKSIQDGLMRAKNVKYVDISQNYTITEQGLAGFLYNLSFAPKLRFLSMHGSGKEGYGELFCENIAKLIRITGSLEILDCSFCGKFIDQFSLDFYKALGENRSLKVINFNNCIGSFNIKNLGNAIAFNAKNGGQLIFIGLKEIIKTYRDLDLLIEHMEISNYDYEMWYGDETKASKMDQKDKEEIFYCNLQGIDVEQGDWGSKYSNYYYSCLKNCFKIIKSFNISQCSLHCNSLKLLRYCFKKESSVQILNISSNKIEKEGAKLLAEIISKNKSISFLDVSNNQIGVSGGIAIAEALINNKTIQTLNIFDNKIGYDGAKAFGEALKQNISLQTLDIGMNRIRNKGLNQIVNGLSENKNSHLKNLAIRFNFITEAGIRNLLKYSSLNEIYAKNNQIDETSLFQLQQFYDENKLTVKLDLFSKLKYLQENKIERTVWVQPSFNLLQLKKFFEQKDIGIIIEYRFRSGFHYPNRPERSNFFNFIEFANQSSVNKALVIAATSQAQINEQGFRIYKAGTGTFIYQKKTAKRKQADSQIKLTKSEERMLIRQKKYLQKRLEWKEQKERVSALRGRGRGRGRGIVRGRGIGRGRGKSGFGWGVNNSEK